jgi:energy-coupling factor transporter ATP-binding protein EcfA2
MPISVVFNRVSFSYQSYSPLFTDLDLVLPSDKTIIISGRNGIGKSTLAMLAAQYLNPVSGTVSYKNERNNLPAGKKSSGKVAYLSQNPIGNILGITPGMDLKMWSESEFIKPEKLLEVINNVLIQWNLHHKVDTPVWELSAGELKSLALAGISLHPERYWILDEPFVSLDNKQKAVLIKVLKDKQQINKGMLIITHETEFTRDLADESYVLGDNGILERRV